jgi:hypothetical protein
MAITLRTFADSDLDALFTRESDPRAVQMAAFTRANPSDRSAFDAHYERVRSDRSNTLLAIDADGEFVGTVGSFTMEGAGGHVLDRTGAVGSRTRVGRSYVHARTRIAGEVNGQGGPLRGGQVPATTPKPAWFRRFRGTDLPGPAGELARATPVER